MGRAGQNQQRPFPFAMFGTRLYPNSGGCVLAEIWESWGHYAYLGAFIWAFFEGETFVLAASALGAATGAVDPWWLLFSVWFGSFLGDQTWFTLGRRFGPRIVRRIKGADEKVAKVNVLLNRYGTWFILSFRFLYGIRNVASAACGLAGLNWARFAVLNFIAAGIWASSFVAAGWFLGALIGPDRLGWAIAGVALGLLLFFVVRQWRRRSRDFGTDRA